MNRITKNRYVTTKASVKSNKQFILCTQCGDIHYKGFWYASDSQIALHINKKKDSVSYHRCPACKMKNSCECAGVLKIDHVPEDMLGPVFCVVKKAVEQDIANNPQHRVLAVSIVADGYILKTTSAQMVRCIGRKILDKYESSEARSMYVKEPKPLQVTNLSFTIPGHFNLVN
jgi:hypothetical protein